MVIWPSMAVPVGRGRRNRARGGSRAPNSLIGNRPSEHPIHAANFSCLFRLHPSTVGRGRRIVGKPAVLEAGRFETSRALLLCKRDAKKGAMGKCRRVGRVFEAHRQAPGGPRRLGPPYNSPIRIIPPRKAGNPAWGTAHPCIPAPAAAWDRVPGGRAGTGDRGSGACGRESDGGRTARWCRW